LRIHKNAINLLTADNKRKDRFLRNKQKTYIISFIDLITSLLTRLFLYANRSLVPALSTYITDGLIWDYSQIELYHVISLVENEKGKGKQGQDKASCVSHD